MLLLSRLWSEAQPVVAAMVAGAVVDFQHSEDLVSQVAETVVMKFDEYDRSRPFTPWALGITRNMILRYYERRAGDRLVFFDDGIFTSSCIAVLALRMRVSMSAIGSVNITPHQLDFVRPGISPA
jgi:DNA-directed RNA polymerase specialized sigma24 family protein